ncbi:hypothetical protein ANANG_G00197690 [Anguilla anguilla]|uniref:Uncharacterized protein n=1 Tax=Anguilla anguilla TaxID=7936 RepID=A0A9D3M5S4_ANGAN|nr:hypothetical protein ANANG_G00197690 [Anguilla anguilla]
MLPVRWLMVASSYRLTTPFNLKGRKYSTHRVCPALSLICLPVPRLPPVSAFCELEDLYFCYRNRFADCHSHWSLRV